MVLVTPQDERASRALNVLSASVMMLNEVLMKHKAPVVFVLLISWLSFLSVSPLSAQQKVALTFDDLPAHLRGNVDVVDEPLTRHPGQAPAWNARDIDDVLAFLNTLTDADAKNSATSPSK